MAEMTIEILKHLFLAVIQGLTEIFPVSSSGHLVVYGHILGLQLSYNHILFLHLGTFLAILYFYRDDLRRILSGGDGWGLPMRMGVSFVTTSLVGLVLVNSRSDLAGQPRQVALLWIAGGALLIITARFAAKGDRTIADLDLGKFILIGAIQGISAVPGISRLGLTLAAGLLLGLTWFEAIKLSMLLSLPVILFANLYRMVEHAGLPVLTAGQAPDAPAGTFLSLFAQQSSQWLIYLAFVAISCVTGWYAIRTLSKYLNRPLLIYFGAYCVYAGFFFISYLLLLS